MDHLRNPDHDRFQMYDKLECMHGRTWGLYISIEKHDVIKGEGGQTRYDVNVFDSQYLVFFDTLFPNLNKFYIKEKYRNKKPERREGPADVAITECRSYRVP